MAPPATSLFAMNRDVPYRRSFTLRIGRDTALLLGVALAVVLVVSYAAGTHRASSVVVASADPGKAWTGALADATQPETAASPGALTSASLVVAKEQLALPAKPKQVAAPSRPVAAKCGTAPCPTVKAPLAPAQGVRSVPVIVRVGDSLPPPTRPEPSLAARLNPLNHVPDAVRQPFVVAGDAVAGWFKRF